MTNSVQSPRGQSAGSPLLSETTAKSEQLSQPSEKRALDEENFESLYQAYRVAASIPTHDAEEKQSPVPPGENSQDRLQGVQGGESGIMGDPSAPETGAGVELEMSDEDRQLEFHILFFGILLFSKNKIFKTASD